MEMTFTKGARNAVKLLKIIHYLAFVNHNLAR